MPSWFYQALFWIYWGIAASLGALLVAVMILEEDARTRASAALLLVPVVLRLLLIK
jgi:hypothetical protein